MKINKKKCRKYAEPGWKMDMNNGLLHANQVLYILRSSIKNIGGQRILVLYIYLREKAAKGENRPLWIMFQSRTEYTTLAYRGDGSTFWRSACFENLGKDYNFLNKCAFYSPKDEERVIRFSKVDKVNGFQCITSMQRSIMWTNLLERQHKREKKIVSRMESVPALPARLENWIHKNKILPSYLFYDYHRSKTPMDGFCTACRKNVQVTGVRHNKRGNCPICQSSVVYKSRGKRGVIRDRNTLQIIQRISEKELIIRIIKIYYDYFSNEIPQECIYENARIFVRWDIGSGVDEEHYYSICSTKWKEGYRPVFYNYLPNFEADTTGHLYHKNLDDVLDDTPWKYCQLKSYYFGDPTPLHVLDYLKIYMKYPSLEYLVKLKLYNLVTDAVYGSPRSIQLAGKNIKEVLGIHRQYLPLLQQVNINGMQLELLKDGIERGIDLDEVFLRWCKDFSLNDPDTIVDILQYITSYKLMKYTEDQSNVYKESGIYWRKESFLSDYRDYLTMCEALEYDMNNSFILFPAKLKEAHDRLNDLSDKETSEAYDRQIRKQFEILSKRYRFARYGYIVIPPQTGRDIIDEGNNLHHCVGRYIKKVATKKDIIMFVRKENEPEKSLCTVELKGNRILQARVFGNIDPPPEINKFIKAWKREVLEHQELSEAA